MLLIVLTAAALAVLTPQLQGVVMGLRKDRDAGLVGILYCRYRFGYPFSSMYCVLGQDYGPIQAVMDRASQTPGVSTAGVVATPTINGTVTAIVHSKGNSTWTFENADPTALSLPGAQLSQCWPLSGWQTYQHVSSAQHVQVLPGGVIPSGLIANTAVFAALLAMALQLRRWIARTRRTVRNCCVNCGYSLDGLAPGTPCPECAHAPRVVGVTFPAPAEQVGP
jgi:hypothetical protein